MNQRLLKARQNAQAAGGSGDELEFLGRVDLGAFGEGNIESAQNDGGRTFEQAHGGPRHGHEEKHRRGHGYGQSLGAAQSERLRHQLADHYMEISDERKPKGNGDDVGVDEGMGLKERQHANPAHQG